MPAGTPASLLPLFQQAQQQMPGANPFQVADAARQMRRTEEMSAIENRRASIDSANQQWQADQAAAGQRLLGTLQQQSTPSRFNPAEGWLASRASPGTGTAPPAPQQGGFSAQDLGIRPSVTYRQPDGGVGHTPTSPASPPRRGADNIQADPGMMDRYRSDLGAARAKEADFRKQMDAARGKPQYDQRARLHRLAEDEITNTQFMIDYYSPGADQQAVRRQFESQNNARRKALASKRS
jgi:hypothetical protein